MCSFRLQTATYLLLKVPISVQVKADKSQGNLDYQLASNKRTLTIEINNSIIQGVLNQREELKLKVNFQITMTGIIFNIYDHNDTCEDMCYKTILTDTN